MQRGEPELAPLPSASEGVRLLAVEARGSHSLHATAPGVAVYLKGGLA